jgi:hypothetical protein
VSDSNFISDATTNNKAEQTANAESQVCQASEPGGKSIFVLEYGRDCGEHEVEITVGHGGEQCQEEHNGRPKKELDGARKCG